MSGEQLLVLALLLLLGATSIAIARQTSLLAVTMLTGIFSLLGASWMLLLDAPDVAITEAAVGAGISTILMLATLAATTDRERADRPTSRLALAVVTVTGGVLVYGTLDMPVYGDVNSPSYAGAVTQAYLASANQPVPDRVDRKPGVPRGAGVLGAPPNGGEWEVFHVGIPNTVTTVLASFRGYDTMGETDVVLTAGFGVLAILAGSRRRRFTGEAADPGEQP